MKLVTRAQWGARKPAAIPDYLASTRGVKIHYSGSPESLDMVTDHALCARRVRQIQAGHMDGNGWNDVGYSFLVCPHGYVHEGRGVHRLPAANGSGLNSGHYAVLGMVGNAGLVVPSDDMLNGIRDAIDYCRAKGAAGQEIRGHRDGYATDCPGPKLYAWVQAGAPRPAAAPRPIPTTEDIVKALPTLRRGQTGEHVETLQALLRARSHPEVVLSGVFDPVTEEALREVQAWGQLTPDGVCGPRSWPVLLRVA